MIAAASVDGAPHRIADQPGIESSRLEALVARFLRPEGRLACTIGNELHANEKAAPADVTDMPMVAEPLLHLGHQFVPLILDAVDQLFVQHRGDNRMGASACCRMSKIGMTVLEETASRGDCLEDPGTAHHRPDRLIAGTKTLGDSQNVRADEMEKIMALLEAREEPEAGV